MKYLLFAASLFVTGSAYAQSSNTLPTAQQNDSAIIVGRGLVSAKLALLKSAGTNTTLFDTYAQQYLKLMRTGMTQRGRKLDTDPKTAAQAALPQFLDIESTFAAYRKLLAAAHPDRPEILRKAEHFQSIY